MAENPELQVEKPVFQGTPKPALFSSDKEALEYELAPSEIRQQKLTQKLKDFREMQADRQGLIDAKISQNGVFGVRKGRTPGIYLDWDTVVQEVGKMSDSEWQKHATIVAAQEYMGMYHISARDACYDPYEAPINQCERKLAEEVENEHTSNILWYAVKEGRTTGVFSDWEVAADQVIGLPNAVYASFNSEDKAYLYLETTKEEYFRSREVKKEVAEELVAEQVKLRQEIDRVHREEEQRKVYRQQSETELYVNPPKGGSAYLVKKLLTKLIQIQAEINKMGDLDKKRKFYIQGLYHELTQMNEAEKEEALEALGEDEYLKGAWDVINDPEHVLYHEMYLMDKQFYKGYGKGVDLETATKEFPSGATYNTTYRSPEERLEAEIIETVETVETEAVEAETVSETVTESTTTNDFFTDTTSMSKTTEPTKTDTESKPLQSKPTPPKLKKVIMTAKPKQDNTGLYAEVSRKLKENLRSEEEKKLKEATAMKEDPVKEVKVKEATVKEKVKAKQDPVKEQLFKFSWTPKPYGPAISPKHTDSLRKIALARYMYDMRDQGFSWLPLLPYEYTKKVNMESKAGQLKQSHYNDAMSFFRKRYTARRQWIKDEAKKKEEAREAQEAVELANHAWTREAELVKAAKTEKRRLKRANKKLRKLEMEAERVREVAEAERAEVSKRIIESRDTQSDESAAEAFVDLSIDIRVKEKRKVEAAAESAKKPTVKPAAESATESAVQPGQAQSRAAVSSAEPADADSAVDASRDLSDSPTFGRNRSFRSSAVSYKFSPPSSVSRDYDSAFSLKSASRDWSVLRDDDEYRNWHHHHFQLGGDKFSRHRFAIAQHKSMSEREAVLCNSQVSYETLSKLTCNCGENIYAPSMGADKTFPLEPRQLTYVPKKIYPNITNSRYQVFRSFKEAQKDYDSETTALSDNLTSETALLLAFNTNWRVLFNSITRKLGPIAADHHGRFERIEGNIVYTDGCYIINSSPVSLNDRQAGWGVYFGDRQMPNASGRVPGEQSSERAELLGMVMAIRLISRNHEYRSQKWTICTDHAWTVKLLEYGWDGLEPKYKLKSHPNFYLIKRLRSLLFENQNITLQCVQGSGLMYGGLREAEKLARKGMMQEYIQSAKLHGEADADVLFYDPALTMHYPSVELPKAIFNKGGNASPENASPEYWTKQ